jgi:hypothetical protein
MKSALARVQECDLDRRIQLTPTNLPCCAQQSWSLQANARNTRTQQAELSRRQAQARASAGLSAQEEVEVDSEESG